MSQDQKIAVNRREMVDELIGKLGPTATLRLWELLEEIKSEAAADAAILRNVRETYLTGNAEVKAGIIFGLLRTWENDPTTPQLDNFFNAMREYTVFRLACKCAELAPDKATRQKVLDAVELLRKIFADTSMKIRIGDELVN